MRTDFSWMLLLLINEVSQLCISLITKVKATAIMNKRTKKKIAPGAWIGARPAPSIVAIAP